MERKTIERFTAAIIVGMGCVAIGDSFVEKETTKNDNIQYATGLISAAAGLYIFLKSEEDNHNP